MSQLSDLARPFRASLVHAPPSGKFGSYVSHDAVTQKLLAVVGPFSFHLDRVVYDGDIVTGVIGALTVKVDGETVQVQEVGDVENPDQKKTNGARLKDASSDAIKRCAMRLGVGLHLWADEYFLYDVLKDSDATDAVITAATRGVKAEVPVSTGQDPDGTEEAGSVSAADPALST